MASNPQLWKPVYHYQSDKGPKPYEADCRSEECPVSVITPQAIELIRQIGAAGSVPGMLHTLTRDDCRMFDAAVTIKHCQSERRAAFDAAISRK